MLTILVYFFLLAFWAEETLGISLSEIKGLSLSNLAIYLLLFAWAFRVAFQRKFFDSNNLNKYLILMILMALVSIPIKIWIAEVPNRGVIGEIIYWKNWTNPFILFFILFNTIDNEKTCRGILLGLILFLFVTALTTPLISLGVIRLGTLHGFYEGRAMGFASPNQYASFLVLFIPLVLTYFLFANQFITKIGTGILLAVSFIALVTTGSRGGALSLLMSMAVYLLLMKRQNILRLNSIILVFIALVIIGFSSFVLAPPKVKETVMSRFDLTNPETIEEISGAHGRTKFWQSAFRFFMEKPILGHGQNSFYYLYKGRFGIGGASHNHYIKHLIEFGIIGLGIYIMIFTKIFLHVRRHLVTTNNLWQRKFFVTYLAGFLGYSFSMLAVDIGPPRYLFWIYTATIYKYSELEVNGVS
jgi:O-antigen ligase